MEIQDGGTIQAGTKGKGNAGVIALEVDELRISQGGFITARTENTGRAGNIEIIASKSVELSDPADAADEDGEDIKAQGNISNPTFGDGNAGRIRIRTPLLTLRQGAKIMSFTKGTGQGGEIIVETDGTVRIHGAESGISAESGGPGRGGKIEFTGNGDLEIENGGTISSRSTADVHAGNAGLIQIGANSLKLRHAEISTQADNARGGDIAIKAHQRIYLSDGKITAAANGLEKQDSGGNLNISGSGSFVLDRSELSASAGKGGDGGNVTVAADSGSALFIFNRSRLSASAGEGGDGGNIKVSMDGGSAAFILDKTELSANAIKGKGGNINVIADPFIKSG
ncbi:MAG: hypothetical protein GY862_39405, partial [Gammaproteobacteria bacterium]|nr:hypothetical protein [Gammaproteobacteria bacterium]